MALASCTVKEEEPVQDDTPVQGETPEVGDTPETITVTDGFGREVTLEKPIQTVASGLSMVTELMVSLGAEDRIIGIDRTTAEVEFLFEDLLSLPLVQTSESHYVIDYEAMITVDPDVFITGVVPMEGFDDIVSTLEPEIPVIALSYNTPKEIVASVMLLGELFDCQEAADEYIEFFQGTMDMITERVAGIAEEDKPKVYYEWMEYFTFNKDLLQFQSQIDIPGGINVAVDMATTYGTIDPEWVIEQNPDVIIAMALDYAFYGYPPIACGYEVDDYSEIEAFHEAILSRSELSEVTAIKEGRVYVIHSELPATSCIGFAYMAKWLHPELFEDLDPQAIHQEWMTRFMGIDYDLDEHGVFVYPKE
ncbi:MAG: ABC transporter substrate-binding protein, partial [Dehalococcoidia bacterium]